MRVAYARQCVTLVDVTALTYLREIREWMDAHPQELVIMWISRHGNTCNDTFGTTPVEAQEELFSNVTSLFEGLLFDTSKQALNESVVGDLVASNQRLVVFVSAYSNFTSGSPLAVDACHIDNNLSGGGGPGNLDELVAQFQNGTHRVGLDQAANRFLLQNIEGSVRQIQDVALITFVPEIDKLKNEQACAASYGIPNMTTWCPSYLQASSQLFNYYTQVSLETATQYNFTMPNAIYLDAVDYGGLIRTGTELFPTPGTTGDPPPSTHNTTGYAYVDTLLYFNVRRACDVGAAPPSSCTTLLSALADRRARNPYLRWDNSPHGRCADWPPLPYPIHS